MITELISKYFGIEIKRINRTGDYSYCGEQKIIEEVLAKLNESATSNFVVDIGASDGVDGSNTYPLFKNGAHGLAVEPDNTKFAKLSEAYKDFNVNLFRGYATPDNIINILQSAETPKEPIFMNFDIDSYDYFVLRNLLEEYRPSVICAEINEKIPTPIKFAVRYRPDHIYTGDHFYGMSLAMLGDLCEQHAYDIINLNYNNAFLVPHEKNSFTVAYTTEDAYRIGYKEKHDRKEKFPWNSNMDELLLMHPDLGMDFIRKFFAKYEGKYVLKI